MVDLAKISKTDKKKATELDFDIWPNFENLSIKNLIKVSKLEKLDLTHFDFFAKIKKFYPRLTLSKFPKLTKYWLN